MHQNLKFPNVKKYSTNLLQTHFQISKRNSNQNFDLDFDVELGQKDLKGSGRLSALVNHWDRNEWNQIPNDKKSNSKQEIELKIK